MLSICFSPTERDSVLVWVSRSHGIKRAKIDLCKAGNTSPLRTCIGDIDLRWVSYYKHMGSTLQASVKETTEVARRSAIIRSESVSFRKVLANPSIPLSKRVGVAQTYIWSKGIFQCATWHTLSNKHFARLHAAVMSVYRIIACRYGDHHKSDDSVISELQAVCPRTMLRARRIFLFAKSSMHSLLKSIIVATSNVQGTWAHGAMEDLMWLCAFPAFAECSNYSSSEWIDHVLLDLGAFKKKVKEICLSPFANLVTQWASTPSQCLAGLSAKCNVCNKMLKSYQGLQLHLAKSHDIKDIVRCYVEGIHCPICMVQFASRECVINHVRYRSRVCYENLLVRPPRLTREEADELDKIDLARHADLQAKGLRRHAATVGCARLSGPLMPIVIDPSKESSHHALGRGHQHRA